MAHKHRHSEDVLEEYLSKPVDVVKLIERLDFTEEDPESAAMEQPALFLEASRYRVQQMRNRSHNAMAAKKRKSEEKIRVREKYKKAGRKYITEAAIEDKVEIRLHKSGLYDLNKSMEQAFRHEEFSKLLVDAFRMRKDAIKIVIDARFAETGSYLRKEKEDEGRRMSRKLAEEVKNKYRHNKQEEHLADSSSSSSS